MHRNLLTCRRVSLLFLDSVWTWKDRGAQLYLIVDGKALGRRMRFIKTVSLEFVLFLFVLVHCKGMFVSIGIKWGVWMTARQRNESANIMQMAFQFVYKYALASIFTGFLCHLLTHLPSKNLFPDSHRIILLKWTTWEAIQTDRLTSRVFQSARATLLRFSWV